MASSDAPTPHSANKSNGFPSARVKSHDRNMTTTATATATAGITTTTTTMMWSPANENKRCQKLVADVLEENGFSLDAVIGGSKISTVWRGKFNVSKRKGPVPFHLAQLTSTEKKLETKDEASGDHERFTSINTTIDSTAAKETTAKTPTSIPIAVKVSTGLTPASRRFLHREMSIWKDLDHPNVVKVFEVFDLTQGCCIVMETTPHGDLLDHIQVHSFVPETDARRIFNQVVSAVDFLHERDIVHRDLKCENVLFFGDGKFKLTDFGFARSCRDMVAGTKVLSETFCGSVPYVAPEVLEGIAYNPKYSDVWSLGVMLYVMLYGILPLPDENVLELLHKAKDQDIFFPEDPDVSDWAIDLILAMMEPDILNRANISNVSKSPWIMQEDETSSDSSLSPPSIIIQGKGMVRHDSFLSNDVENGWSSEASGDKDNKDKESSKPELKRSDESCGDGSPDIFECSRHYSFTSTSSDENVKQQKHQYQCQ